MPRLRKIQRATALATAGVLVTGMGVATAAAGAQATPVASATSGSAAKAKPAKKKRPPPSYGNATIASVDGPGRLTLKTTGGRLKVKLFMVDTPQQGECGADESTAALRQLTQGRRARVRYVQWSRKADAEGRVQVVVGPRRADLIDDSIARDLVATEWARTVPAITISESDGISMSLASESPAPRVAQGLWARCGGRLHLPLSSPVPSHAPASWSVNEQGIAEAIGPLTLPQDPARAAAMRLADVEAVAAVETSTNGRGECRARVPSLQLGLRLEAASGKGTGCRDGTIKAIFSVGPGIATTTRGLQALQGESEARAAFPRLTATTDGELDGLLPLAGYEPVATPWQTIARLSVKGRIIGFGTTPMVGP